MDVVNFIIKHWDSIAPLIGMVLVYVLALPKAQEWKLKVLTAIQDRNLQSAQDLAIGIVSQIYDDTVRTLKEEGEFTSTAKRRVKDQAIEILTVRLKQEGIQVLQDTLPALIEWAVNSLKKDAAGAAGLLPFSVEPDLASPSGPHLALTAEELTATASAVPGMAGD